MGMNFMLNYKCMNFVLTTWLKWFDIENEIILQQCSAYQVNLLNGK